MTTLKFTLSNDRRVPTNVKVSFLGGPCAKPKDLWKLVDYVKINYEWKKKYGEKPTLTEVKVKPGATSVSLEAALN